MSGLADIRAAILASVGAVPEVGPVHAYERYMREERDFAALYLYQPAGAPQPQVRGWWLRRWSTDERSPNVARSIDVHTWRLRGYMALADADASELVFDELIEAIRTRIRHDPTFGGVCNPGSGLDGDEDSGVQVGDVGPVRFCGVLCHSAVLTFKTWSYQ
ncbi:hypothetical protein [Pseudacidovorax intermedius]|uniref:Uncharacterized protein n=1 Tax=Pseudacidovorax intermedius TaxID=433924 RepID=A0A147GWB0_9BURK|nr:hypothetical protein [Pseudacidovorax intermedius]KTT21898.1 hypothetical protein NS331_11090 [Pseudacidovorax intermedius]